MRPTITQVLCGIFVGAILLRPVTMAAQAQTTFQGEPLRVYAAGSLTGAFNALLQAFGMPPGKTSKPTYGPSGPLRERLEGGEAADLFASADMGQPRRLAVAGRGTPVVLFARNRMCALGPELINCLARRGAG